MPVITVQMLHGKTLEQKRALVEKLTGAVVDSLHLKPELVHVVLQEIPRENWGRAGVLGVDRTDV